ncbi:MAG: hypothetical protein Q8P84_01570 [Deltaproteobacteria bacterium]|nr:hypothetical protein [Deltaproteobacteria bacterium]
MKDPMKAIPFFANIGDGTHCYQAALKMVLHFFTGREWSFEELDKLSGKKPGQWTWPTQSLIWLLDHGYQVKLLEEFDYKDFGKRGRDYLAEKWGEEVAKEQETHSDLVHEQALALEFAKRAPLEYRVPEWDDLEKMFDAGYLLICNVNASLLHHLEGYSGHFVVPVAIERQIITIHDPGLPPSPSLRVAKKVFEKAWGYPTRHERNLLAIRK